MEIVCSKCGAKNIIDLSLISAETYPSCVVCSNTLVDEGSNAESAVKGSTDNTVPTIQDLSSHLRYQPKDSFLDKQGYRLWGGVFLLSMIIGGLIFISLYFFLNRPIDQTSLANPPAINRPISHNQATNSSTPQDPIDVHIAENIVPTPPTISDAIKKQASEDVKKEEKLEQKSVTNEKPKEESHKELEPTKTAKKIEIENSSSAPKELARDGTENNDGKLTVQVASYNALTDANERAEYLKSLGVGARVIKVNLPNRGVWYRVQTGRFAKFEEATRYGDELRAKGAVKEFIVTKAQ
jgi:cell division septation protein DedD